MNDALTAIRPHLRLKDFKESPLCTYAVLSVNRVASALNEQRSTCFVKNRVTLLRTAAISSNEATPVPNLQRPGLNESRLLCTHSDTYPLTDPLSFNFLGLRIGRRSNRRIPNTNASHAEDGPPHERLPRCRMLHLRLEIEVCPGPCIMNARA